jgi:Domain of unknown function DUF11
MVNRGPARAFTAVLTAGALIGYAVPAAADDVRPFEPRFERRVTGDISIVRATSDTVTAARPAGSMLLFAGLYWGGPAPLSAAPDEVALQVGSAAPTRVVASDLTADTDHGFGAVADVTSLFRGTGPFVDLTVENAGIAPWALVTAWSSPSEPLRDLRVMDGLADATAAEPATVTVSGLSTPPRGPVETTVDVVTHGADARATADIDTGDTAASVHVRAEPGSETLVAAVTTATEAAAVTDLGVSTAMRPAAGRTVSVTVTVTNGGPDDQTGPATLTVEPADGLVPDPVSLTATDGACGLTGDRAVCAVDPLPAGRDSEVSFDARVADQATRFVTASARTHVPTSDIDPVTTNDTSRADLRLTESTGPAVVTEPDEPGP